MQADNDPLISVILPAYNAARYIQEAINSILSQTYKNFELLIADDGSTDNTRNLIDSYTDTRIRRLHNETNQGKTRTVNRLFSEAHGEFITIHDADDVSHPLRFEKQMKAFKNDSELALCGTSFYTVNDRGYIIEDTKMSSDYTMILEGLKNMSQFHGPTMMMKHSALEPLRELYRPYFRDNYEDTDLAYRIAEKHKSINLLESLYIYRIVETSLCRKDVDIRNRNLYKVVAYLAQQRSTTGKDSLINGKPEEADMFLNKITEHYQKDPSLIYREAASYYFYWKLTRKAIQSAWRGFIKEPFTPANLRTLLYILRKKILNLKNAEADKIHYQEILRKNF